MRIWLVGVPHTAIYLVLITVLHIFVLQLVRDSLGFIFLSVLRILASSRVALVVYCGYTLHDVVHLLCQPEVH